MRERRGSICRCRESGPPELLVVTPSPFSALYVAVVNELPAVQPGYLLVSKRQNFHFLSVKTTIQVMNSGFLMIHDETR